MELDAISEFDYPPNFSVGKFSHNRRIWIAFAPAMLIVLFLGGKLTLSLLLIGLAFSWVLELIIPSRETNLLSLWFTLIAVEVGLMISSLFLIKHSIANLSLFFVVAFFILLVGLWATLQFAWIQAGGALFVVVMERALFAIAMYPVSTLLTWITIAFQGIENAPFYYFFMLYFCYYSFSLPLKSSFKRVENSKEETAFILGPIESAVNTFALVFLPILFYISIYHGNLYTLFHLTNILLLISLSVLSIQPLISKGALWWTRRRPERLSRIQNISTFISVVVIVACFEYRVVFHSFYHWISIYPPYSYIAVTVALYSFAGLIAAHFLGFIIAIGRTPTLIFTCICAVAVAFVLRMPFYLLVFPIVSAYAFVTFYFKTKMRDYLIFVACTAVCLLWFMGKMFWFLDFQFSFWSISIQTTSRILTIMFILSFLIPGFALTNRNVTVNGLLVTVHALGMVLMESVFFEEGEEYYPFYLIVMTSVAGIIVAKRLTDENRISPTYHYALSCIYFSKLGILFAPIKLAVPALLMLSLTISPIFFFQTQEQMTKQQGLVHAISIGISTFVTRNTIAARIVEITTGNEVSASMLLAIFLISWGVACLPLSMKYFRHISFARSVNLFILISGLIILINQPDSRYDFISITSNDTRPGWPNLLLLLTMLFAAASLFGVVPFTESVITRRIFTIVSGISIGSFISAMYLPSETGFSFYILLQLISYLIADFTVFLQWPSISTNSRLPFVFSIFFALLPIGYIWSGFHYSHIPGLRNKVLTSEARVAILGIYATGFILICALIKLKISSTQVTQPTRRGKSTPLTQDWMPYAGNLSSILGFLISVFLNMEYLNGSQTCIFFLAPILLFLNQDRLLFKNLTPRNRYFPIILSTSTFLILHAIYKILIQGILTKWGLAPSPDHFLSNFMLLLNWLYLLCTLPSHFYFNQFMWTFSRQSDLQWYLIAPLNLFGIFMSEFSSIQMLGVLGVIGAIIHFVYKSEIQKQGKEMI